MSHPKPPHEIERSPRSPERPTDQYKMLLRVDVDWGSTGIWEIEEPGARFAGKNVGYDLLPISSELRGRFEKWTAWHELGDYCDRHRQADPFLFGAYAWSLAIDLKRELGEDFYVECGRREIHDDVKYLEERRRLHARHGRITPYNSTAEPAVTLVEPIRLERPKIARTKRLKKEKEDP